MSPTAQIQSAQRCLGNNPPRWPRMWRFAAWITGIFSLLVAITMLSDFVRLRLNDPLNSATLKSQKAELRSRSTDESLKISIRQLDWQLRQRYFRHVSRNSSGVCLLLGGVALFMISLAYTYVWRPPVPGRVKVTDDEKTRSRSFPRWSVAAFGTATGTALFILTLSLTSALPPADANVKGLAATGAGPPISDDAATAAELAKNWPRFRGPEGNGASSLTDIPTSFNATNSEGIAWNVAAPGVGFSSPIIWGEQIFLSGESEQQLQVYAIDARTGQLLWKRAITAVSTANSEPEAPKPSGPAAATMATDGRRVYALFDSGDLAALTLGGERIWSKCLGPLKNMYGHASSLAAYGSRLFVQLDQGESRDAKSKLYAFDGRTGQIIWQKQRTVGASWASPIIFDVEGQGEVLALAVPALVAYASADGAELWRAPDFNGEITPSLALAGDLVLAASPSEKMVAFRPPAKGSSAKATVAWTAEENVPDVTSPASDGKLIFMLTSPGLLTALDALDGKKQWEHDFEMDFHASPGIASGRVYLFSSKGTAVVLEAGRQFKELYRTELRDEFHASPSFLPGRIIVRGVTNLWCLGIAPARLAKE